MTNTVSRRAGGLERSAEPVRPEVAARTLEDAGAGQRACHGGFLCGWSLSNYVQEGTYYSEADSEGADAAEPRNSQSYLAHVAARAVILIEADNPFIGLTAFVPVGMSDVSSCMIDPKIRPGYHHHVGKGEGLGYFQFGGSTHCLVFRPGVIAGFP